MDAKDKMTKDRMSEFIRFNADFWRNYKEPESNELLLVETPDHLVINHSNAVAAKMVAAAKKLKIAWLQQDNTNIDLMRSYSKNSIFIKYKELRVFYKVLFLFLSVFYYLYYILFMNRIHSFKYKGIHYGDFIYDIYLGSFSKATFHRFDIIRIIKVFYRLLERDQFARVMLSNYSIKAILLAHMLHLKNGPLARIALQHSIPVYLKTGGHDIFSLSIYRGLDEVYNYWAKPSSAILDQLTQECPDIIEKEFDTFIEEQIESNYFGPLSIGFGKQLKSDLNREDFLKKMNLKNRPIIFVMLHAFNDSPHSHYRKMLFRDYYDWFLQTYRYALNDKSKNWIFKQHPFDIFYKTTDCNLLKLFSKSPDHIRFIPYNSEIKAPSVLNIADAIVTCLSSAGLEMPAFRGIPSIIAGNTFYDGFGFTIEPKTKKEYFSILKNLNPQKLSYTQQLRSKCCYLYASNYIKVPFAAGPPILYEGMLLGDFDESYYDHVLEIYKERRDVIYNQFEEYVKEIENPNFRRLLKLPINLT